MLKKITFVCLLTLAFACGGKKENTENSEQNQTAQESGQSQAAATFGTNPQFTWQIEAGKSKDDEPLSTVSLVFNGKKITLVKEITGEITPKDKEEYKDLQVPANAYIACSGYWAGGTSIIYVLPSSDTEVTVIKAYLGEEGGEAMIDTSETVKVADFK